MYLIVHTPIKKKSSNVNNKKIDPPKIDATRKIGEITKKNWLTKKWVTVKKKNCTGVLSRNKFEERISFRLNAHRTYIKDESNVDMSNFFVVNTDRHCQHFIGAMKSTCAAIVKVRVFRP